MKQISVFTFDELSDDAKEHARQWGREMLALNPCWVDESSDSIDSFLTHFGARLRSYDFDRLHYDVDAPNDIFRGLRLNAFTRDAMPTGYFLDCVLWETFYDSFKRTGSAKIAFHDALHAALVAFRDDLESQQSDDYVDDFLIANEYFFLASGDRVPASVA
ncbi:MAG: hypothetical protein RL156_1731 [Bacteroidota bacterium]|jgi:hypothetical protein